MPHKAVAVRRLAKRYENSAQPALRGVDLEIATGQFVAVMGPSGSGKSTLLHLMGGLDRPTAGEVRVDGRSLAALSDDELSALRRTTIGFVFQSFNLVPVLTAAQNVGLPAMLDGAMDDLDGRVDRALAAVGLAGAGSKLPAQLSGGEQQRVAIARALFVEPTVLLADEPTGSLDSGQGARVLAMLRALVDYRGVTVVMVTHDPAAAAVADDVLLLRDGVLRSAIRLGGTRNQRVGRLLRWLANPDTAVPTGPTPRVDPPFPAPERKTS